MSKRKTDQGLF